MNPINGRLANTAYALIIFLIAGYLFYIGKMIMVPIIFGIIIAFLLYPINRRLEKWYFPRVLAIMVSMIFLLLIVAGVLTLFSSQFMNVFEDFEKFTIKINEMFQRILNYIKELPFVGDNFDELLNTSQTNIFSFSGNVVGNTLVNSTMFIGYSVMVFVYTFLFLLYRSAFKNFIISRFSDIRKKRQARAVVYKSQQLIQSYFGGVLIVVLILGTINSLGLYIIGIEHALLFGFFAAFLNIIPYIGTTIGGSLPVLYALLNYDELWRPIAVLIFYQLVQTVEGNFITPKIVGSKVSINPFIAIVVLIIGGFYWGIAGMVLSIPLTAIVKLVFDSIPSMQPYGHLLASDFYGEGGDTELHPWRKFFRKITGRKTPPPPQEKREEEE